MTSSPPPQDGLFLLWFLPLFIAFWLLISATLSFAGGWHALARKYRGRAVSAQKSFRLASMSLAANSFLPVSYGSCLTISLSSMGLGLSILFPFRFLHPNLFIPWSAISFCAREKYFFFEYTAVYIDDLKIRMVFAFGSGRAIHEAYCKSVLPTPCDSDGCQTSAPEDN